MARWKNCDMPAPSGVIPYGPFIHDADGIVYSIDMFRPRFPLRWQNLRIKDLDGKYLPLTDDNILWAFREQVIFPLCNICPFSQDGAGRFNGNIHWWNFSGVRVTLHKFKPFGSDVFNYSCLLEFNPNKYLDSPILLPFIREIKRIAGEWFCWYNTRIDFTVDVPYPIRVVRLLTRKVGSSFGGTYYFGSRGSSGYTRVYDKRKELLDHYGKELGRDVTRVEYELRSGVPAVLDPPFLLASDLGRYEILRYVAMADMIPALRTFDERTAAKIRKDCFKSIPFDPSIFELLRSQLLDFLGLDHDLCRDRAEYKELEAASMEREASDLERLMASLRRFCGEID